MKVKNQQITIKEFIMTIHTPSDILKAISSASNYTEELNNENAKLLFTQKQKGRIMRMQSHYMTESFNIPHQTTPQQNQMAALILIVPVKFAATEIFQWCQKLFPYLNTFPQIVSSGMMMRFAESSLILNQADSTLQTMRWGIGRYDFLIGPYLFLCASSKNPIDFDITSLTNYPRVDSLAFYYLGINLLMIHDYEKALNSFLHSLTIHSPSDCSKEIGSAFFLACFLNHIEEQQARSLISDKIEISEEITNLFETDIEIDLNDDDSLNFSDVLKYIIDDVNEEIKRRRIVRFVSVTSRIPVDLLVKKTKLKDEKILFEKLKILKDENVISFRVLNGIVYFSEPNLQPVIDKQYHSLVKSTNELKLIYQKNLELIQNEQNENQNQSADENRYEDEDMDF